MELNTNIVAMPKSIMDVDVSFLNFDMRTMMVVGINENRNALAIVEVSPDKNGMIEIPQTMLNMAPKKAPDEIPIVYGSASGLRMLFCIMTPPIDSPTPTNNAPSALGRRTSQT